MEGEAVPPEARQSQLYKTIFIYYTGFAGILEYTQNEIFIRHLKVKMHGSNNFTNYIYLLHWFCRYFRIHAK
jgi:hypothetical protein